MASSQFYVGTRNLRADGIVCSAGSPTYTPLSPERSLVNRLRQVRDFADGIAQLLDGSASGVIFKHSPECGLSSMAYEQVVKFTALRTDVPVMLVDVLGQRALSNRIAELLGLQHESPQVIVMAGGQRRWSASHRGVNATALAAAIDAHADVSTR